MDGYANVKEVIVYQYLIAVTTYEKRNIDEGFGFDHHFLYTLPVHTSCTHITHLCTF